MIYVASPYSHEQNSIKEMRYVAVTKFVAVGIQKGLLPFSPITYCHDMAKLAGMKDHALAWQGFNKDMLKQSECLLVYGIDGWTDSIGVKAEVAYMHEELGKPCYVWTTEPSGPNYEQNVDTFWKHWPRSGRRLTTSVVGGFKIISREKADALDRDSQASE